MSSSVDNELVLSGSPDSLTELRLALGNPEAKDPDERLLEFDRLVPMPNGLIDRQPTDECVGGDHAHPMDWHCWRLEHWGTSREATDVSIEGSAESGSLRYEFETRNTTVFPLLQVIAARWPGTSIDFAFLSPAEEHAGTQHYSPTNGWSEREFASGLPHLRSALGASRLASRVPDAG